MADRELILDDAPQAGRTERVAPKNRENHCPFGCAMEDLDELGYCDHLLGFVSDPYPPGKVVPAGDKYEPITYLTTKTMKGMDKPVSTGNYAVVSGRGGRLRREIPKKAKVINPEFDQRGDDGIIRKAKKWISARVYVKDHKE